MHHKWQKETDEIRFVYLDNSFTEKKNIENESKTIRSCFHRFHGQFRIVCNLPSNILCGMG